MDFNKFQDKCLFFFQSRGLNGTADNLLNTFSFEPDTRKTGGERSDFFDGMQILYFVKEGIFEVSEYQAGPKGDQLHVYLETKSLKIALNRLLKGNRQRPVKIW